jgi:hypothetical protein
VSNKPCVAVSIFFKALDGATGIAVSCAQDFDEALKFLVYALMLLTAKCRMVRLGRCWQVNLLLLSRISST